MNPFHFFLVALAIVALVYMTLRGRGDPIGWWLGLGHSGLAMLAVAGWAVTVDSGFAVAMSLLATYAGAMSASEIATRLRGPQAAE